MSTIKEEFFVVSTQHGDFKTKIIPTVYKNRKKWAPANPLEVVSRIPGTVVEFLVKPGDEVKEEDVLLVFKAMKMNNLMKSSLNGKIKRLCVEPGESVPKGTVLLEFE